MPKKVNCFIILIISFTTLVSCDSSQVFDEYKSLPNKWHKDSVATFNFKAPDTIHNYNLFINLRNTNDYAFSNLYLIAELNYPNEKVIRDTLRYKMAAPNGEFLGNGFSDIKENKLWYKGFNTPFRFSEIGDYKVTIQHAMRKSGDVNGIVNLEGVTDIGFRIENTEKQ